MSLSGDLATMDLGDLLRNLEMHGQSGLLTVEGPQGRRSAYVDRGRIVLFQAEGRPGLMEVLVACGEVAAEDLERARKKRRRSRKSLGEVLIALGLTSAETLHGIAAARLLADACELLVADAGAFLFSDVALPRGVFDPEERRLGLGLPIEPVLLEAARRMDHWRLVRERVPSDSAHYLVQGRVPAAPQADPGQAAFTEQLLARLDGTRNVTEAMAAFPHRRFEAYQLLADLVAARVLRAAGAGELAALARDVRHADPERAWEVVRRGLDGHPQHLELLAERALLAEGRSEPEAACEALKMAAHLRLEAGDVEQARADIDRARRLQPEDTALLERSLALALDVGAGELAGREGRALAGLYRAAGLHRRAQDVYERLLTLEPDDAELRRALAHSQADSGDVGTAIEELERYGRRRLGAESYRDARAAFAEILELDAGHAGAQGLLAEIDGEVIQQRRARRRKASRRALGTVAACVLAALAFVEGRARSAYVDANRSVSQERLIERGRYAEALQVYGAVRADHRYSATAWFGIRERMRDLEDKARGYRTFAHPPGALPTNAAGWSPQGGASAAGIEALLPATFSEPPQLSEALLNATVERPSEPKR